MQPQPILHPLASAPAFCDRMTLVEEILEKLGVEKPKVAQLPIEKHVDAIKSGKVDAIYTFEPIGTIGKLSGVTRVLEAGVIAKYILGDPSAP
jgi:NitT/TauT family transport system substrate-binding protein